jgi:hypothetical protein
MKLEWCHGEGKSTNVQIAFTLKQEKENAKLKKSVAGISLDKAMSQDVLSKSFEVFLPACLVRRTGAAIPGQSRVHRCVIEYDACSAGERYRLRTSSSKADLVRSADSLGAMQHTMGVQL